jgi:hypothetical protein
MDEKDIQLLFKIARYINPSTHEAIQNYINNDFRPEYIVQYKKQNKILAIWFDTLKLNERDLKYIFKNHPQSSQQFFIHYIKGFYRIGFKIN